MKWVGTLERRLRPLAIENLTLYIVITQSFCFVIAQLRPGFIDRISLIPSRVIDGEWWRVITCIFVPPTLSPLFLLFALYMFWLMGTALERQWGAARYNLYLLIGYLASLGAAFLTLAFLTPALAGVQSEAASSIFVEGSVFLAFAWLFPDFQILLFLILPVKIKWLAWLAWAGYALAFIAGPGMSRLLVIAAILNFLIFFGPELLAHGRVLAAPGRKLRRVVEVAEQKPFHVCTTCGVSDKSNVKMEFRYCPECKGTLCYCIDHIAAHEHKK